MDTPASRTGIAEDLAGCPAGNHHRHRRLLRARRERPCGGRAAEQRYELAALHSITSSARSRIPVGIVMPSALAALRLTTVSNMVDCCTGRSAGLAPLR